MPSRKKEDDWVFPISTGKNVNPLSPKEYQTKPTGFQPSISGPPSNYNIPINAPVTSIKPPSSIAPQYGVVKGSNSGFKDVNFNNPDPSSNLNMDWEMEPINKNPPKGNFGGFDDDPFAILDAGGLKKPPEPAPSYNQFKLPTKEVKKQPPFMFLKCL